MRHRLAARRDPPTESTLVVPVPEADFVSERWALRSSALPPHVTVLYPFLDPEGIDGAVQQELEALARAHPPFDYALSGVDRFPRVLYLSPAPPEPFVALTQAVHARWPSHPPYGGKFDEIVPHLTLVEGEEPDGLATAVTAALPIQAHARELVLWQRNRGAWTARARFPLGG